jgi:hypothetical protein
MADKLEAVGIAGEQVLIKKRGFRCRQRQVCIH